MDPTDKYETLKMEENGIDGNNYESLKIEGNGINGNNYESLNGKDFESFKMEEKNGINTKNGITNNGFNDTSFGSTNPIMANSDASDMSLTGSQKKPQKGWFVTPVTAFIIVLAALAFAAIIGLIVGLAHPDRGKTCPIDTPETTTSPPDSTSAPTTTEGPPVDIQLPTTIWPYHYNIRLRPDIYGSDPDLFVHTGSVDIYVTCNVTTNVITIHFRTLEIDDNQVTVTDVDTGVPVEIENFSRDEGIVEFYMIHLRSNLQVGTRYKISIPQFSGPIKDDLKGLYYSSYTRDDGTTGYLVASQCQPVDARKIFPLFDEPAFKSTFEITMERKKDSGYECMSNMEVHDSEEVDGDWIADHFTITPIMSSYILAFVVSDFECATSNTTTWVAVDICSRTNAFDQTEFAASIATDMQDWFAEYHDVPYPLPKNSHVAVPDFGGGAMENWGLIIYRETALLFDPASSTSAQRQRVAVVVSHELAHMWFGNLVTMLWWDDVWLNEGFASYMEVRGVDSQFPSWKMEDDFVIEALQDVFTLDALPTSHPVYVEVTDPAGIFSLFDTITYSKGSSVIRMMRNFLSEETFKKGLSNYLKDREYQSATHADVFNFMSKQAEEDGNIIDVHAIMNTWILQLGYPVVKFEFDRSAGKIKLTQEHFLLDPTSRDQLPTSPYNYMWTVPITFATDQNDISYWDNPEIEWLEGKTVEFDIPSDAKWVIGNLNEAFYYRVDYDDETWQAISDQLAEDHTVFGLSTRSQLVDDAFNLGRAGVIEQTVALEISSYLGKEEELFPWQAFRNDIAYISDMLVVTGSYGDLQSYIQKTVEPVYNDSLWENQVYTNVEDHVERLKRTLALQLTCTYGGEGCIEQAYEQFTEWMEAGDTNPIDVDLRPVVYCNGLAAGGKDEWEFAFEQLEKSNSGAESQNLLDALGCTRQDWLLRRYLEEGMFGDVIRTQDFRSVIGSVAANSLGRSIAWEMFVQNWDLLFERYGNQGFLFAGIVDDITFRMSTQYEYNLVEKFMEDHPDQGNAAAAFIQALDKIKVNIAWKANNQQEVLDWLKDFS